MGDTPARRGETRPVNPDAPLRDRLSAVLGRHENWQLRPCGDWECACGHRTTNKIAMDNHQSDMLIENIPELADTNECRDRKKNT